MNGFFPPGYEPGDVMQAEWDERTREHVLRSVRTLSLVFLFGLAISVSAEFANEGVPLLASRLGAILVSTVIFAATLRYRDRLTLSSLRYSLGALLVPAFVTIGVAYATFARNSGAVPPPPGFKLALIVLPCLEFGSLAVNVAWMIAIAAEGFLCWLFFIAPTGEPRARSELISLVLFAAAGAGILLFRRYRRAEVRRLFEAETRAGTAEHLAKIFLGIRDRANTPLQSFEVGIELLKRDSSNPEVVRNLENAFSKLKALFEQMSAIRPEERK